MLLIFCFHTHYAQTDGILPPLFLMLFLFSTELGSPRDLQTRDVTDTSFLVSWVAAPGNVRQYRIRWKSLFTEEEGEKTTPGGTTDTVLEGLTPETRYQVSVFAAYGHGEGQPLVGEETTDSKSCLFPNPSLLSLLHFPPLFSALHGFFFNIWSNVYLESVKLR